MIRPVTSQRASFKGPLRRPQYLRVLMRIGLFRYPLNAVHLRNEPRLEQSDGRQLKGFVHVDCRHLRGLMTHLLVDAERRYGSRPGSLS